MANKKTESEWEQIITACKSSGITAKNWCETNHISFLSYKYWLTRLNKQKKAEANISWAEVKIISRHLPFSGYYDVPYDALVEDKISNLITVGRCISTTFEAQGAIRVSPIAGAVGHAGGTAAFLSMQSGMDANEIDYKRLQQILRKGK